MYHRGGEESFTGIYADMTGYGEYQRWVYDAFNIADENIDSAIEIELRFHPQDSIY